MYLVRLALLGYRFCRALATYLAANLKQDSTFDNARACNEFPSKLNTESMPVELLRGNLGLPVDNFTDDMMSQQDDFSSSLPLQVCRS